MASLDVEVPMLGGAIEEEIIGISRLMGYWAR